MFLASTRFFVHQFEHPFVTPKKATSLKIKQNNFSVTRHRPSQFSSSRQQRKVNERRGEVGLHITLRSFVHLSVLDPDVTDHYGKNHKPLVAEATYGAPFTNTKEVEEKTKTKAYVSLAPEGFVDKAAYWMVKGLKPLTHFFFRDKYTHHAVVLETVAAVPGMVAGMLRHFKSLRRMERDHGWIGKLIEEAENERMHLLTWMQLVQPTMLERFLVICAQFVYTPFYAVLYVLSPRLAHRFVGYLEEEATEQYTLFLNAIDEGKIPNVPAPEIAIKYWNLPPDSKLRDVVVCVRADEMMHRDLNHALSKNLHLGLK